MTERIKKLSNKIKVLEVQKERDRKRLLKVAEHAKKIYNITSQLEKQS